MMGKKNAAATVAVKLLCVYCGDGESANPGDVIHVDANEEDRLFDLKAAVAYAAPEPDIQEEAPAPAPDAEATESADLPAEAAQEPEETA
jgi:hypothetical protein